MKAYILKKIGHLEYMDVPIPSLQSGWALIQVDAAGICGSDIPRIFSTGTYHFPTIPGHEFSGRVVDVFDEEDKIWIGKRVGIFPLIPCKKCAACNSKQYEMCNNYDYLGSRRDGGFAEFAAVPVWNLIELPEQIGMKEAAMLEPASVALHAVRRLQLQKNDTAALFGLGTIGIMIVQWLSIFGLPKVYTVGHDPGHGNLMQTIVSDKYQYHNIDKTQNANIQKMQEKDIVSRILDDTQGLGTSIAVDCIGTSDSLEHCLNCVKPGGQILIVGNPKENLSLNKDIYWKILRKQVRITGTWNSSFMHDPKDDWHKVIESCCNGTFHISELITHQLTFDKLHVGLHIAKNHREYHNKIMICSHSIYQN